MVTNPHPVEYPGSTQPMTRTSSRLEERDVTNWAVQFRKHGPSRTWTGMPCSPTPRPLSEPWRHWRRAPPEEKTPLPACSETPSRLDDGTALPVHPPGAPFPFILQGPPSRPPTPLAPSPARSGLSESFPPRARHPAQPRGPGPLCFDSTT